MHRLRWLSRHPRSTSGSRRVAWRLVSPRWRWRRGIQWGSWSRLPAGLGAPLRARDGACWRRGHGSSRRSSRAARSRSCQRFVRSPPHAEYAWRSSPISSETPMICSRSLGSARAREAMSTRCTSWRPRSWSRVMRPYSPPIPRRRRSGGRSRRPRARSISEPSRSGAGSRRAPGERRAPRTRRS